MKDGEFNFSFLDGWTPQESASSLKSPRAEEKADPVPLVGETQKGLLALPDKSKALDFGKAFSIKPPNSKDCFWTWNIKLLKVVH